MTLELVHYLKSKGLLVVGIVRADRLHSFPLTSNKELKKEGRGAVDNRVDYNSGIIVAKRVDNSTVQLVSNHIGIEPMSSVERWSIKEASKVPLNCTQIVMEYNKSMGGAGLTYMLISIYRVSIKANRW